MENNLFSNKYLPSLINFKNFINLIIYYVIYLGSLTVPKRDNLEPNG